VASGISSRIWSSWNARKPVGTDAFKVGENLALTPGKVIFRNELIELIQYEPACERVSPEPVLIVPAWIMKYYILDLSPENSLVRYLTQQGFTVFMISWKNAGAAGNSAWGSRTIADSAFWRARPVREIVGGRCAVGTASEARCSPSPQPASRDDGDPLKTVTLLAGQVDFKQAGELTLFINEPVDLSRGHDMGAGLSRCPSDVRAFQLLRSLTMIWSP
jgi:polyhydroxyalkanoate synthase